MDRRNQEKRSGMKDRLRMPLMDWNDNRMLSSDQRNQGKVGRIKDRLKMPLMDWNDNRRGKAPDNFRKICVTGRNPSKHLPQILVSDKPNVYSKNINEGDDEEDSDEEGEEEEEEEIGVKESQSQ